MKHPPKKLTVSVTWKHIREGVPEDPNQCAIALAIAGRAWVDDVDVEGGSSIAITVRDDGLGNYKGVDGRERNRISTFIHAFDEGCKKDGKSAEEHGEDGECAMRLCDEDGHGPNCPVGHKFVSRVRPSKFRLKLESED